jgi:hypothetical protein
LGVLGFLEYGCFCFVFELFFCVIMDMRWKIGLD